MRFFSRKVIKLKQGETPEPNAPKNANGSTCQQNQNLLEKKKGLAIVLAQDLARERAFPLSSEHIVGSPTFFWVVRLTGDC